MRHGKHYRRTGTAKPRYSRLDGYEAFRTQLNAVSKDLDPVIWNLYHLLKPLRNMQSTQKMSNGAPLHASTLDIWYREYQPRLVSGIWLHEALSRANQRLPEYFSLSINQFGQGSANELQASRLGQIGPVLLPPIQILSISEASSEVASRLRGIGDHVANTNDYGIIADLERFHLQAKDYNIKPDANPSRWKVARALTWDIVPNADGKLRRFDLQSARDRKLFCTWWLSRCFRSLMSGRLTQEEETMHKMIDEIFLKGSAGRRFFSIVVGLNRTYGWGPKHMEKGDIAYQFPGSETPFVLRMRHKHAAWIGDCFVLSYMGGVSSLPDYNRHWRRWLEEAAGDLLEFRRFCSHDLALTIDGVVKQVQAAVSRLQREYMSANRKPKDNEVRFVVGIE